MEHAAELKCTSALVVILLCVCMQIFFFFFFCFCVYVYHLGRFSVYICVSIAGLVEQ